MNVTIPPGGQPLGVNLGEAGARVANRGAGSISYSDTEAPFVAEGTIAANAAATLYGTQFFTSTVGAVLGVTELVPGPLGRAVDRQSAAVLPTGALGETTGGRSVPMASQAALTSGILRLGGWEMLAPGIPVNGIVIPSGSTAATTPTNQWFCLVRVSDRVVLAKTADDTTTAWAAGQNKSLAFAAPYVPTAYELVYKGVLVVATAVPTLVGWSVNVSVMTIPPIACGNSTTSLTDPASLGATAAAITPGPLNHYGYTV